MFKKSFIKYGVPFLVLVVGGSFGLREFAQLRYTFSTQQKLSRKEMEDLGVELKDKHEVTVDAVYEEVKKMDIDNWSNIRGPRPWEEPPPELVAKRNNNKKLSRVELN